MVPWPMNLVNSSESLVHTNMQQALNPTNIFSIKQQPINYTKVFSNTKL